MDFFSFSSRAEYFFLLGSGSGFQSLTALGFKTIDQIRARLGYENTMALTPLVIEVVIVWKRKNYSLLLYEELRFLQKNSNVELQIGMIVPH